jgi:DNA polymerase
MSLKTDLLGSVGTRPASENEPRATVDFETRSACDILKEGAWKYSQHPTTQLMCLYVRLPHWPAARGWHPAYPRLGIPEEGRDVLDDLFVWLALGGLIEAHNAFFERSIWTNICVARYGWPAVPEEAWRCSAAKASAHSLPRSLGAACAALGLEVQKDNEGRRIMLKVCKPRKPKKAEAALIKAWEESADLDAYRQLSDLGYDFEHGLLWHEDPEELGKLFSYCGTDVDSEHGLSAVLPDLSPLESRIWAMDQAMNLRGVRVDVKMAKTALRIVDRETARLNRELEAITGGAVEKASQRSGVKLWLASQGVDLPDTQGPTLDTFLAKPGLRADLHRVIKIVREVNRTSTAKYKACLAYAAADGRIRDMMMYHGASTGRWSGKGLQPHNFPRGTIKDMELACSTILTGEIEIIRALYGEAIGLLSEALRGLIMASEGRDLIVADYAAIEARVVMWLAGEEEALEVFRSGDCIYCDMATGIYGYKVIKGKHPDERQLGKQAILGLGFGMGFVTFLLTCRKYKITFTEEQCRRIVGPKWAELAAYLDKYYWPERQEGAAANSRKVGAQRRVRLTKNDLVFDEVKHELVLMKHIVDVYRAKYASVAQMWEDVEAAAVAAVRSPGREVRSELGRVTFRVEGRFLKCYLPSGRALHYCDPRLVLKKTPWGSEKPVLLFMGVDALSKQWCVQDTYGGKLVENITQATARDLMAEAMLEADESGIYDVILSVHDELIAEVDEGVGSVDEFEELMSRTPGWAAGCPVAAEGWRGKRYRK